MNDDFYLSKDEPIQSCLLALRKVIKASNIHVSETVKYGMPCFCFKNKMFCYLWTDKKDNEPYILFVEGKHLDHPKLEDGNRSRMKILRVNSAKDLPIDLIHQLLNQALDLYISGTIKTK